MSLWVEVSPGELWDRITILEIRAAHVTNPDKLAIIKHQIGALRDTWANSSMSARVTANFTRLIRELRSTNEAGWAIEDQVRLKNDDAKRLAFLNNDYRNSLKLQIDAEFDVDLADEKIHSK